MAKSAKLLAENAKTTTKPVLENAKAVAKSAKLVAKPVKPVRENTKNGVIYRLTVDYKTVNFTGKNRKAMVVNGSLPAPTLFFKEGEKAVVYVTNKMNVETSIHWHGIFTA